MGDWASPRSLFALCLGVAWPLAQDGLFYLTLDWTWIGALLAKTTSALGFSDWASFKIALRVVGGVFWSLVYGIIFGLPLGFVVRKQLLRYWLIFVLTAIAT